MSRPANTTRVILAKDDRVVVAAHGNRPAPESLKPEDQARLASRFDR